ncbi:MAG: 16S rRNA (cytosine(967)-C(5))-methyltransferase RsmB [Solirubrobacteraceae bacterium]
MPSRARVCADAVVRRVFEQCAYADQALQSEARDLDARDRALAMRLAYGAIQRRATLDHLIERLAERPLARLDPAVLAALRLGLYELLYLQGAPDHAVVDDSVELAKRGSRGGHGLVNAVLRRAAREGREALLGRLRDEEPEDAAILHSHPLWIARMWFSQLGPEQARALMAADNEPGEVALRVNTLCADPASVAGALGAPHHGDPNIPEAIVLDGPLDVHGTPAWQQGLLLAQSRAAMLVSRVLDPQPGERVLDLCAAPGGKTTHIAALMGGEGEVVAVERNAKRASNLQSVASRMSASSVTVEVADAATPRQEGEAFDRVLVDPPCSGLGTLAARPDLRWRANPERLGEMVDEQARILDAGAAALRPGGVLVYSTCTISCEENERQVERLQARHPQLELDPVEGLSGYAHPRLPGALLTLPHRDRTAGFFIARLRRSA